LAECLPDLSLSGKKIKIARAEGFAYVASPFEIRRKPDFGFIVERPQRTPARVGQGGHNNTKVNPVFRGMVRPAKANFEPKEICD
jgi:hypothetical protein